MIGYPNELHNEMAGAFAEMLTDRLGPSRAIAVCRQAEQQDWFWEAADRLADEIVEKYIDVAPTH